MTDNHVYQFHFMGTNHAPIIEPLDCPPKEGKIFSGLIASQPDRMFKVKKLDTTRNKVTLVYVREYITDEYP